MSDPNAAKPGETAPAAIDITKYVPKEDFEKLTTDSKNAVDRLKGELDNAKLSLLDPEYIAYIESKKSNPWHAWICPQNGAASGGCGNKQSLE